MCLCGCRVKKVCNFLGFASGGRALGKGAEYFVYELGCRASDNINQRLKLQRIKADKKKKAQEKARNRTRSLAREVERSRGREGLRKWVAVGHSYGKDSWFSTSLPLGAPGSTFGRRFRFPKINH